MARFSKQDYDFVAGLLCRYGELGKDGLAESFAAHFAADNPRFDIERWNHAVKTGEVFPRKTTKRAKEVFGA